MMMFGRNQHNSVKQLSFNCKINKFKIKNKKEYWSFFPREAISFSRASPLGNLAAMWETQVQSLDWEDLLKKGMKTHSSILAWTQEPGGIYSMELQRVGHN